MHTDLTLSDFRSAHALLQGHILFTPLVASTSLHTPAGQPILLKAENLQPSGSFKIRGASYSLSQLTDVQCQRGVIAYSTGNHAQAVALAAQQQHIPATIVISPDVPSQTLSWKLSTPLRCRWRASRQLSTYTLAS